MTLNDLKTAWREPGIARLPDSPAARDAGAPVRAPAPVGSTPPAQAPEAAAADPNHQPTPR